MCEFACSDVFSGPYVVVCGGVSKRWESYEDAMWDARRCAARGATALVYGCVCGESLVIRAVYPKAEFRCFPV